MNTSYRLRLYIAIYLLSMSVLAYEVGLSRILAATTGYHMAFLAVSLTIFGLGAGGFALFLIRRIQRPWAKGLLVVRWATVLFPISLILYIFLLIQTDITQYWLPFLLIMLAPFFLAGIVLSHLFRNHAALASPLYAFDLLGAAMGCLVVLLFLRYLDGGIRTVLATSILATLSAFLFPEEGRRLTRWALASATVTVLGIVVLTLSYTTPLFDLDVTRFKNLNGYMKQVRAEGLQPKWEEELSYWDEFSRVDVIHYQAANPPFKHIFINGATPTNVTRFSGNVGELSLLRNEPGYLAFTVGSAEDVCCIGSGAGKDIWLSLLGNAKNIDAVEINPGVVRASLADRDFNGGVLQFDRVNLHVEDGRSFVTRAKNESWDVIYLFFVQSITGDFKDLAFVEDYLYTVEAAGTYFDHLKPGGRMVMVTHLDTLLYKYLSTLIEMLRSKGMSADEALKHVSSFFIKGDDGPGIFVTMLFKDPPPIAVAKTLEQQAKLRQGRPLHLHGVVTDPQLLKIAKSPSSLVLSNIDLSPCTDDKPFFFRYNYDLTKTIHLATLAVLATALLCGLFLYGFRRRLVPDVAKEELATMLAYFLLIGINFTLIQIAVMQKSILFLGYPTLSLSVVLFTMLVGAGTGSFFSRRLKQNLFEKLQWIFAAISGLGLLYAFGLGPVYRALMPLDPALKMTIVFVLLFPLSFLLGMPMPLGLRRAEKQLGEAIPFFWGLNGVASVLGSLGATSIALSQGFRAAWLLAVVITLGLILLVRNRAVSDLN